MGLIDEALERCAKPLSQFCRGASDEISEPISLEPQPQPFNGIEVGRIARQELHFKVMPVQPAGFMPGGVVQDQQVTDSRFGRHGLGHLVHSR